ncbi:MAG TPA: hypothetical protein VNW49_05060 [Puia sp.]|nr:hypothetical protein [Puia sp.]
MIFELVSWILISLICLIWGNMILKLFFGNNKAAAIDFPIVCFIGMTLLGTISFYISLFIPLYLGVKLALQIPALMILFKSANRRELVSQIKKTFINFSVSDYIILVAILLMILFISTSKVIHPDTLNYHVFSTQIFDKYGTIPGFANLKPEFGFQSIWFSALAFFDFPVFQAGPLFTLNGCVMIWVSIFLISKAIANKNIKSGSTLLISGIWYLILILFCILSWTQIRLTASSLSPDFIVAASVLLSFYFFAGRQDLMAKENSDLLASLFSIIAISIKLSAAPIILIPFIIIVNGIVRKRWLLTGRIILSFFLLLVPIIIRNIFTTGYPFYPSVLGAFYSYDWKVELSQVLKFQYYITSYARYPILRINTITEYNQSIMKWFPLWWKHLYMIDKTVILIIAFGVLVDISFFRTWVRSYSKRKFAALIVAITGVLFWFVEAPDPRFGTGFLLPLIYFQYAPLIKNIRSLGDNNLYNIVNRIKYISTFIIIIYTGYRAVYFFRSRQLLFPEGIDYTTLIKPGCDGQIKKMIIENTDSIPQIPDSCRNFLFRGTGIRQGFKPAM